MTGGGDTPSPTPDISGTVSINDSIDGFDDEPSRLGTIRVNDLVYVPVFIKEASTEADSEIYIPASIYSTGSLTTVTGSPGMAQTQTIQHVLDAIANAAGCPVLVVKRSSAVTSRDVFSIMPDNYRGAYRYGNPGGANDPILCTISRDGIMSYFAPSDDNSKRIRMASGSFTWALVLGDNTPVESVTMSIEDDANFSFSYHGFDYVFENGGSSVAIPELVN